MDPTYLRLMERIIAVIIGGISIYLGYRLFLHLPNQHDSEGRLILPGNISVYVSRVGPGIFFGLFGTAVVALSIYMAVTFKEDYDYGSPLITGGQSSREFTGVGPSVNWSAATLGKEAIDLERLRMREHVAFLNQLPPLLDPSLPEAKQQRIREKTRASKLYLMSSLWGPDWGRYEDFKLWAEGGSEAVDSNEFREAEEFYWFGQ